MISVKIVDSARGGITCLLALPGGRAQTLAMRLLASDRRVDRTSRKPL